MPDDNLIEEEDRLSEYEGDDEVIPSQEMNEIVKKRRKKEEEKMKVKSGIPSLDEIVEGFREGNLITITGAPGSGKTAFLQSITENMAQNDVRQLWFSYELPPSELFKRWEDVPSFYLPKKNVQKNLDWIEERVKEAILKYGIQVIYVDYLHFLVEFSRITNSSLVIGGVMRELKKLAINERLVMFLVVPPTKVKQYQKIEMHQMRDSSLIQHTADIVMSINRIKEGERVTDTGALHILKHRRTGELTKKKGITLKHTDGIFKELENNL